LAQNKGKNHKTGNDHMRGISGDAKAEGVVIHIFERPINTVVSECKKAPKDALSQKIKKNF